MDERGRLPVSHRAVPRSLLVLDPIAILLFAAVGRDAHRDSGSAADPAAGREVVAIVETAAPFLIGMAAGWLVTRAWRRPAGLRTGAAILVTTIAGGMALRNVVFDRGTPPAFVAVATVFLGVFLLGWRIPARRFTRPTDGRRAPGSTP